MNPQFIMAENLDWVLECVKKIRNTPAISFVLKKSKKDNELELYKLPKINTGFFHEKIDAKFVEIMKQLQSDDIVIKDFYQEPTRKKTTSTKTTSKKTTGKKDDDKDEDEKDEILVLDVQDNPSVESITAQILESASGVPDDDLKSYHTAKFSAILFNLPNKESVIAFDSISIYHKESLEKSSLILTHDMSGLNELDRGGFLIFKPTLPCIYFEKKSILLIFNKEKTERLFDFTEYYQKKARVQFRKLENEDLIELNERMFESEIEDIKTAKQISKMSDDDSFITDVDQYKKYDNYFKTHPEIEDELTQLEIRDDKVILDTDDKLNSFLNLTKKNILTDILDKDDQHVVFRKRKVKKTSDEKK